MKLLIAEKPSIARAIAEAVGQTSKGEGFIHLKNGWTATWCFGHLLSTETPEEVHGGRIEYGALPIVPKVWKLKPKDAKAGAQVKIIQGLLKKADGVVSAGDPDREGQLLVDEVLEFCGWKGHTERLWLASMDEESVKKALATLKNNIEYQNLKNSAQARQYSDWLVGFNASIAISRRLSMLGKGGGWSVGRVQTPTLALVVQRDAEIANFKEKDFYQVIGNLDQGISATWQTPADLDGTDDEGRLLDRTIANATAARITGKPAKVLNYEAKQGKRVAPLPYALSELQKVASKKYGMSAQKTLNAAQKLYEEYKATSYPRTDCGYLPEEQLSAASRVLKATGTDKTPGLDLSIRHPAWNTKKITAHHAIIPTGTVPGSMDADCAKVFALVKEAYTRLFLPPELSETRTAEFDIDGLRFKASRKVILAAGWTGGTEKEGNGEDIGQLPELSKGQTLTCSSGEVVSKRTTPPKPYTDGTLIGAMTNIHKLVTDPVLKARLRETSGIGTEATRANMLETLIFREYMKRDSKGILKSTMKGQELIDLCGRLGLPLIDPLLTAFWEDKIADIAAGKLSFDEFMRGQIAALSPMVEATKRSDIPMENNTGQHCPKCKASSLVQRTFKQSDKAFCSCTNPDCNAAFFQNEDGTPGRQLGDKSLPSGGSAAEGTGPELPCCKMKALEQTTKNGAKYLRCPKCRAAYWADKTTGGVGKKWDK